LEANRRWEPRTELLRLPDFGRGRNV